MFLYNTNVAGTDAGIARGIVAFNAVTIDLEENIQALPANIVFQRTRGRAAATGACSLALSGMQIQGHGVGVALLSVSSWSDQGTGGVTVGGVTSPITIDGVPLPHMETIEVTDAATISTKPLSQGLPVQTFQDRSGRMVKFTGWLDHITDLDPIKALQDDNLHTLLLPTNDSFTGRIITLEPDPAATDPYKIPYNLEFREFGVNGLVWRISTPQSSGGEDNPHVGCG
jgi:hypothetical protein